MRPLTDAVISVILSGVLVCAARAEVPSGDSRGSISGTVKSRASGEPLASANVLLVSLSDGGTGRTTGTDAEGHFIVDQLGPGRYRVECSYIGYRTFRSGEITVDSKRPRHDLGVILLAESNFALDEVVITTEKALFDQNIDRKVYNVDREMLAKSSTASDILQNIPSVQVDMDGNVSLRGSPDVLVMVNGKTTPLMRRSRADVLQQMPAASIEKIEVITNPSARFTPEGTTGIINIVLRKGGNEGASADLDGHLGGSGRHNESMNLNWRPGPLTLYGNYSYRHDRRERLSSDQRTDSASSYARDSRVTMRPHAHIANLGLEYTLDEANSLEWSAEYFHRRPWRSGLASTVTRDGTGAITEDLERAQSGYENESDEGTTAAFEHRFPGEDQALRLELNLSDAPETEDNRFVDRFLPPGGTPRNDHTRVRQEQREGQLTLGATHALGEAFKLEAGYAANRLRVDIHAFAEVLDSTGAAYVTDPGRTYDFRADQTVHAWYGTLEHGLGAWRVKEGLRFELARVASHPSGGEPAVTSNYAGFYPTLHLVRPLGDREELQLNYSRRIHRPETDDLNPYQEYSDPRDREAGNPHLKPETIHSVELGWHWTGEHVTLMPTLYYRYRKDAFTRLTTRPDDSTLVRTLTNLSHEAAEGFEPVITVNTGERFSANLSGDLFHDRIDASDIGLGAQKSVVSWSGTLNLDFHARRSSLLQANANWRSARLTPQGKLRPSWVMNAGFRQELRSERLSFSLAVSDLFRTQRQDLSLDINGLDERVTNRRDSRLVYAGLTYHFGRPEKKSKNKAIQYEEQP